MVSVLLHESTYHTRNPQCLQRQKPMLLRSTLTMEMFYADPSLRQLCHCSESMALRLMDSGPKRHGPARFAVPIRIPFQLQLARKHDSTKYVVTLAGCCSRALISGSRTCCGHKNDRILSEHKPVPAAQRRTPPLLRSVSV